jgi:hypothetical protein
MALDPGTAARRRTIDLATAWPTLAEYGRRNLAAHTPVNGCAECGVDHHEHGFRWHTGAGMRQWTKPTGALRKSRLIARQMLAAETAHLNTIGRLTS